MRPRLFSTLFIAALLLLALLPIQGASGAKRTVYRGKTAQKQAIQLAGTAGQLTLIRFKVKMLCRDGSLLFGDLSDFQATPLKRDGSFSDTQHGPSDTVFWHGRVRKGKVSGSLRVTDRLEGGVRCDSGAVRFSVGAGPSGSGK